MTSTVLRISIFLPWALLALLGLLVGPDYLRRTLCDAECQAQYLINSPVFRQIKADFAKTPLGKQPTSGVLATDDALRRDKIGALFVSRGGEVVLTSSFGRVGMLAKQERAEGKIQWQCDFFVRGDEARPKMRPCSEAYPQVQ